MIEEYPELVLSTYKKMRDNGELHTIIPKETTAALKNACLRVYDSRYNPDDADILSVFFNVDKLKCDFRKVIFEVKSDYFKALWNHIREETETTDERNSDLLAWLIDFKPRPSGSYYRNLREGKLQKNDFEEEPDESGKDKTDDFDQEQEKSDIDDSTKKKKKDSTNEPLEPIYVRRFSLNFITISCIIFLFVGSSSFVAWERSATTVKMPAGNEKCMYWNVDHYEPIDCKKQVDGATIIPLDLKALGQQRKINLPDTLTSYSLGKVWYKGFMKDHEFFTAAGTYPTDTARVLKRLTPTILAKYISNSRYLLTRLTWLSYATVFVALCGFGASRLKKKVKPPMEVPEVAEEDTIDFTQPQAANC